MRPQPTYTLSSAYRRTARGLVIALHDSSCSRLRVLDRGYERTIWWCRYITSFNDILGRSTRIYHTQFGKTKIQCSHCDPQFDGSSTAGRSGTSTGSGATSAGASTQSSALNSIGIPPVFYALGLRMNGWSLSRALVFREKRPLSSSYLADILYH